MASKLRVDLFPRESVSGHMDEPNQIDPETDCLINELLARLGILMEDASTTALLRDSCGGSLAERVGVLEVEINRMKSVCAAARALLNGRYAPIAAVAGSLASSPKRTLVQPKK